jgi:hypothetical protein
MVRYEVCLSPEQKKKKETEIKPPGGRDQEDEDQETNAYAEQTEERIVPMRNKRMAQKNPPDKKKEGWDQGAMQHLTLFLSKSWRPDFGTFSLTLRIPYQGGRFY